MSDYKHGEMDIETQERTFVRFVKIVTYTTIGIIVFLLFLAAVNG